MRLLLCLALMIATSQVEAAKVVGRYDAESRPPTPFEDIYSTRPVAEYRAAIGAKDKRPDPELPPKLYDSEGNYIGRFTDDPFDPESINNPQSRYYKAYINPYEEIYIVQEEVVTHEIHPSYLPRKTRTIEIDSGPVWSGPFWNHW